MAIPVNSVPQFKSVWVLSCHLLQLLPEVKLLGALPSTLEPFCALPASNVQLPEQYVILCLVCKQKRKASGVLWVPEYSSHLEDGRVGWDHTGWFLSSLVPPNISKCPPLASKF